MYSLNEHAFPMWRYLEHSTKMQLKLGINHAHLASYKSRAGQALEQHITSITYISRAS